MRVCIWICVLKKKENLLGKQKKRVEETKKICWGNICFCLLSRFSFGEKKSTLSYSKLRLLHIYIRIHICLRLLSSHPGDSNIYVYVYVCIYVCIYMCVHICVYIYVYIYICDSWDLTPEAHIYIYMRIHIYIYMHICVHMCVYIYLYIIHTYLRLWSAHSGGSNIYVYVYVCIYIRIYICVHMCVYIYVYIYICDSWDLTAEPQICIHTYTYIFIYVYIYVYIYAYTYTYTYIFATLEFSLRRLKYVYIRIHVYLYTHIYMCT